MYRDRVPALSLPYRLIIVGCCMLGALAAWSQQYGVTKNIRSADGLSNDFVVSMAMDDDGCIWVGTEAGVNKIAGKTCRPLLAGQTADRITDLYWHRVSGNMLIGTERGLTICHLENGMVRHLYLSDGLIGSSINDIVEAGDGGVWLVYGNGQIQHLDCETFEATTLNISETHENRCALDDGKGHLYIGHSQYGMTVMNLADGSARNYRQQLGDTHSLAGNNVRCICQDSQGRIWVGTDTGLVMFCPETGSFTKVTDRMDNYDDNVYDICQTKDGKLWVATDIGGVKVMTPEKTAGGGRLFFDETTVQLSSLNSRRIAEDEYGNIWVGSHSTGVDFISVGKQDFNLLDYHDAAGRPSVYAIADDSEKGFWMASDSELVWWQDGGVKGRWSFLNRMRREYVFPRCMMADRHGDIWIGIDDQGVYRFNKKTSQFSHIPIVPEGSDIHTFSEDDKGRIWIGGEFGVYLYENGKAALQEFVSKTIHAPATSIMETAPHQLFIATLGDGIYSVNLTDHTSRHINIPQGLPSSKVNNTIRDGRNGLWLATDNGLVYIADPTGLTGMSVYGSEQGLSDSHIRALQQDADGKIWLSTYTGISCFVKHSEKFYNYNYQDTRIPGGFTCDATTIDDQGNIYFGSMSGVCYFNPRQLGNRTVLSDVNIISCEAYNPVGRNTEIQFLTPDSKGRVCTTYQQNTIRLTFAMRNFALTDQVDYSYKMKGMDDKWYDIANDHDVVFRGLRPGRYTFVLRAKLRSQDWDQANETQLTINIDPPFWRTWWAYLLYVLVAVGIICSLMRSYKRKLTLRNTLELERHESLQKQELNEERLRFFTNITHELRTPLTLILGPLDDLMEDHSLSQQNRHRVALIHKNAERLRSLITEILEFRKTETQNRQLTVARGDIGRFVSEICHNYKELNRKSKVSFVCDIADQLPEVWFDSEVVTTILNNFLSNAVKYTEEGSITTTVRALDGSITISVADTGYGIAPEAMSHIFERYYQAKGSHQASGTGIGLALVRSLASLHEGQVSVESHEGQGSCFTFTLQTGNTYPNALHKEDADGEALDGQRADGEGSDGEDAASAGDTLPVLLVVEDNADIREYIADTFGEDFHILQAENGEEGVQKAKEYIPDIIVSDIMMPRMNGIEMTRLLKADISTCHIPIILLTAKNADEDKEEGYDSGADSYLTKPFTSKLLVSRIRNLLAARRRLADYITGNGNTGTQSASPSADSPVLSPQLSGLDREFVEKLNKVIEDNIMQDNIDMSFVTSKMAMSHSTFYRKVKGLTGMTATEYIRKRRLRYCYQLLASGDYNVNQAAMMTGFNQMSHFRETFKKEFGILPSEVKKK